MLGLSSASPPEQIQLGILYRDPPFKGDATRTGDSEQRPFQAGSVASAARGGGNCGRGGSLQGQRRESLRSRDELGSIDHGLTELVKRARDDGVVLIFPDGR